MRQRFDKPLWVLFPALVLILLSIVGIARFSFSPNVVGASSSPQTLSGSAPVQVTYPVLLPSGYGQPTGLVGGPGSVWFFAQGIQGTTASETLFHWSSTTSSLSSFNIDSNNVALDAGGMTPIVVDRSGQAWLGINTSLLVINPSTGSQQLISLPPVTVGALGSGLPTLPSSNPGQIAPIDSLTTGPGGQIIVGRTFATELQVVNPTSFTVSNWPLPSQTALAGLGATDLASNQTGNIVYAVLYSGNQIHELGQYIGNSWTVADTPCPAYSVATSGNDVVVRGPSCIETGVSVSDTAATTMSTVSVNGLSESGGCVIMLSSTKMIACLQNGLTMLKGTSQSPIFSLGTSAPGVSSGGGVYAPSPPIAVPFQVLPILMSAGISGEAWFVPNSMPPRIGLMTG